MKKSDCLSKYLPLGGVATLLVFACNANAATVTNSANFTVANPVSTTTSYTGNSGFTSVADLTASLAPFDTTLGTLTSATISFTVNSAQIDVYVSPVGYLVPDPAYPRGKPVTDSGVVDPYITDAPQIHVSVPDDLDFPFYASDPQTSTSATSQTISNYQLAAAENTYTYLASYQLNGVVASYTFNSSTLSELTSSSTPFEFYITSDSGTSSPSLPAGFSTNLTNLSGTASITYTYTAVPEPASLGALGLGAVALAARRRK